jgi:hypothetical protein
MRLLAAALLVLAAPAAAQPAVEAPMDRLLGAVVRADGRVDYDRLRRDHAADLREALAAIAAVRPAELRSDAQRTAFLLNAYNAYVLDEVTRHPRARHLEREGLFAAFFQTPVAVAGLRLTLNQLEHGVLRRQATVDGRPTPRAALALRPSRLDARIHVGLNCAAVSCPPLPRRAFRAATVNADLSRAFAAFAASPAHLRLDGRTLVLSSILDWFGADFEASGARLGDVLVRAMPTSRPGYAALRERLAGQSAAALKRDRRTRFVYDWTINRAR